MVLRVSSPTPQRSCRKCGTFGAWLSEPPNNELATNSYFSSMPRFVINHPDYWYRSAKAAAESISKVLWLGLSLAITVIVLKLIGESKFTVQGVQVPLGYSAIPYAMLTAVHLFCANQFVRSARRYWELTKPKQYGELFKEITSAGGWFMRGMQPRILPDGSSLAPMGNDPATWLSYLSAIMMFFACLLSASMVSIYAAPSCIIVYVNWVIGSYWSIALSELAV